MDGQTKRGVESLSTRLKRVKKERNKRGKREKGKNKKQGRIHACRWAGAVSEVTWAGAVKPKIPKTVKKVKSDGWTDRRTDGWTNGVTYRVACTRLKMCTRLGGVSHLTA